MEHKNILPHKLKLRIFQDPLKKRCSPMVKGRIEFAISFLEPVGNYVPNGNVQLLWYINSNCVLHTMER